MSVELKLTEEPSRETGRNADTELARPFIPVAAPVLNGNEKKYVADCMDSGWISSTGKYVAMFESNFADFCGVRHAVACCNGTVALHLALLALGVEAGDEVIVPTLTFIATANAVTYCGARPVFADSEPETWNLDPAQVERQITARTKAIIAVHLYGYPAAMDSLRDIARRHQLFLVEDAAEAHGALYRGRRAGALGDIATFSFYGNKIISTGEGGMVVTNDDQLATRVRLLRGQGMDAERRYWFPVVGYNYRMMNLTAAIGVAQLEQVEWHMGRRQEVAAQYRRKLQERGCDNLVTWQESAGDGDITTRHAYWMFTVLLRENAPRSRDEVMAQLLCRGIETRPVFYPIHLLPPYRSSSGEAEHPVAESLARRGVSLPTWGGLSEADVDYVCDELMKSVGEA